MRVGRIFMEEGLRPFAMQSPGGEGREGRLFVLQGLGGDGKGKRGLFA